MIFKQKFGLAFFAILFFTKNFSAAEWVKVDSAAPAPTDRKLYDRIRGMWASDSKNYPALFDWQFFVHTKFASSGVSSATYKPKLQPTGKKATLALDDKMIPNGSDPKSILVRKDFYDEVFSKMAPAAARSPVAAAISMDDEGRKARWDTKVAPL